MLMVLDDDHAYGPHALGDLSEELLGYGRRRYCGGHKATTIGSGTPVGATIRGELDPACGGGNVCCTFFSYFFRGLMVPQGADITAFRLSPEFPESALEYHRAFVVGDEACFLVDDLWIAMYLRLCGADVVSLRDRVLGRGLETIYTPTGVANVNALSHLGGDRRRDLVSIRAFEGLLARLQAAGEEGLARWGGARAVKRIRKLAEEVQGAERRLAELEAWLAEKGRAGYCGSGLGNAMVAKAEKQLAGLKQLYRMQASGS
mmetsp:Transcript_108041/g.304375  ORF Transcript_108041/g.304375 Transcript_108041/m.304375 type:complete len:261 (+) Transcript_108041:138-920(+)